MPYCPTVVLKQIFSPAWKLRSRLSVMEALSPRCVRMNSSLSDSTYRVVVPLKGAPGAEEGSRQALDTWKGSSTTCSYLGNKPTCMLGEGIRDCRSFLNLYLLSGWMMTPQNILLSSMSVALNYSGWSSPSSGSSPRTPPPSSTCSKKVPEISC